MSTSGTIFPCKKLKANTMSLVNHFIDLEIFLPSLAPYIVFTAPGHVMHTQGSQF